ncbi:MAG TPA: hypothetical protein VJT49_28405 [Amycolatopsis sp.]|uniref:hypothetical protein n=1 Tax=Amycolatopsis sp. TaxID=37632 RepID=UPI002B4A8DB7|nr:hypothetical protein [Amycolatopsis sp.]HKS48960.1 hypothetical protein [Amycolatopsis sp.]
MADPLTLGAVGAVALTEGIKFLYDQARELLKQWREKRVKITLQAAAPEGLDAPLAEAEVPETVVAQHAETLSELRRSLIEYADEGVVPDPNDPKLLESVDALRRLLEVAYGQRITFRGETRERTGSRVDVSVEADVVEGYVAALRARGVLPDDVRADLKVKRVAAGGQAVGVDIDDHGR